MTWIIIGAAIGFFVGGAIGTIVAPQRARKILDALPEQLSAIRNAAEQAAGEAEETVRRRSQRSQRSRGRRRRRSRGRRSRT